MTVIILSLLLAMPAQAETLVAARSIRAQAILSPEDVKVIERSISGMLTHEDQAIGLETRVSLYPGRPIRPEDLGPPAIIERNQIVTLIYRSGNLTIAAEARALGRAGIGDMLRVMNLNSRSTVMGLVQPNGSVTVGASG